MNGQIQRVEGHLLDPDPFLFYIIPFDFLGK